MSRDALTIAKTVLSCMDPVLAGLVFKIFPWKFAKSSGLAQGGKIRLSVRFL
jgi:hypothetical protein